MGIIRDNFNYLRRLRIDDKWNANTSQTTYPNAFPCIKHSYFDTDFPEYHEGPN